MKKIVDLLCGAIYNMYICAMLENFTLKDLNSRSKSELINLFQEAITSLVEAKNLINSLEEIIEAQKDNIHEATSAISEIKRQLGLRNKALFSSTSEKRKNKEKGRDNSHPVNEPEPDGLEGNNQHGNDFGNSTMGMETTEAANIPEVLPKPTRYRNGHPGRKPLPAHLPRVETHYYPDGFNENSPRQVAPEITESLSLQIKLYVKRDVRHKFATREGGFAIYPMPKEDPFYKFKASSELVCTMMYLRFALYMPYNRVLQLIGESGQSYSSLMGWASRFFSIISVLGPLLEEAILEKAKILAMDETVFKVLDTPSKIKAFKAALIAKGVIRKELKTGKAGPIAATVGNRNNKHQEGENNHELLDEDIERGLSQGKEIMTGYVWAMLNPLSKLVIYKFSPSRASINATIMLDGYEGNLMTDAYSGYNEAVTESDGKIDHSKCWAHARREIYEARPAVGKDHVLERILKLIGWLYKIENDNKELDALELKNVRQKSSARILNLIKIYIENNAHVYAPKEAPRKAMQYILNHWGELSAYPNILYSMIDNNAMERNIKPVVMARKNVLFLGSVKQSSGSMLLYSLMECCKMNGINPAAWINEIIPRILSCESDPEKLKDLLPHKWRPLSKETMPI